jgi:hypothetical protein
MPIDIAQAPPASISSLNTVLPKVAGNRSIASKAPLLAQGANRVLQDQGLQTPQDLCCPHLFMCLDSMQLLRGRICQPRSLHCGHISSPRPKAMRMNWWQQM